MVNKRTGASGTTKTIFAKRKVASQHYGVSPIARDVIFLLSLIATVSLAMRPWLKISLGVIFSFALIVSYVHTKLVEVGEQNTRRRKNQGKMEKYNGEREV